MAFKQLYYTSCEHGLSGFGGYQFNAVTPGVPPPLLGEIEERTVYEPPGGPMADTQAADRESYPVALSHGFSPTLGTAITARAVFAGRDYSGRPGNYFVHALVTSTPEEDFGPVLPVELWEAEFWRTAPADDTTLPELPGPPPPGRIDRAEVQAFLDARHGHELLPQLLTAADRALAGQRPVLIASPDAADNAWWIAAVCYLLGDRLARRLTFTTYSHRPTYSPYHLIGTLPALAPPEAGDRFQLFEPTAGRIPGDSAHPLATLLADTGVMAGPGLWHQATAFASGDEQNLDDWLPPAALAAALLGRTLRPEEAGSIAGWLPGAAGSMPAQLAEVALGVAVSRLDETVPDRSVSELLELARRLPAPDRAEELERALAGRAVRQLSAGQPARPVRLISPAVETARNLVAAAIAGAAPGTAVALVQWAADSGVPLPDPALEEYGRTRLDPEIVEHAIPLLRSSPAVLRGLLERLASEPPVVSETLLAGAFGAQLRRDDLAAYPGLTELWLLKSASRGDIEPLRALDEIVDLRASTQQAPLVDSSLLHLLWPRGCPPADLADLLGILADPPGADVLQWFMSQVGTLATHSSVTADWLALARVVAGHPILASMPEEEARAVRGAGKILLLLGEAQLAVPQGDPNVFARLFNEYPWAGDGMRRLMRHELPDLLIQAHPLSAALRGCPDDVGARFCRLVASQLVPARADIDLAARVFITLSHPEVLGQPDLSDGLATAFGQVGDWPRRDITALTRTLEGDAEIADRFRKWYDSHRSGLARRLFGGPPRPMPQSGKPGTR